MLKKIEMINFLKTFNKVHRDYNKVIIEIKLIIW